MNRSLALSGEKINFFASFPHAHTAGRGVWTKIIRDGKEITEIIRDDNYDFDFQVCVVSSACKMTISTYSFPE